MGIDGNSKSCIEQLAHKTTNGDCTALVNRINDCFLSVSEHLPRLDKHHDIFTLNEELPDAYCISVDVTLLALQRVKDVVTPYTHISEASRYILHTIILTFDGICTLS